jgi:benzylsuccinate CoA-transferase BbsE subunit
MLRGYRILDLTRGGALMAGKVLADLGAEVIVIEPPGGSPTRAVGPFIGDRPEPERSLYWSYLNLGKKGITLGIAARDGQQLLQQLVQKSQAVIESFPPGFLASLGLGYADLQAHKPDLIMASITPFGQEGPWRDYEACDLTIQSLSGFQFLCGEPDRPPLRVGFPQVALLAAVEAAFYVSAALFHRGATGKGQYLDISMQAVAVGQMIATAATGYPTLQGEMLTRHGQIHKAGAWVTRFIWECRDGYVSFAISPGPIGARSQTQLVEWMAEEQPDLVPTWLRSFDWAARYTVDNLISDPELSRQIDQVSEIIGHFLKTKTKAELFRGAFERRILLTASNSARDLSEDPQLSSRDFFLGLEHGDLGREIIYPGQIARVDGRALRPTGRAPRIGQHNEEVYGQRLGLSPAELVRLREIGVI